MYEKRGISPIIATVLLIALVVAIGAIVFVWLQDFTKDSVEVSGQNPQLVCEDLSFDASYSNGKLSLVNEGNYLLYGLDVRKEKTGGYETERVGLGNVTYNGWPEGGIESGGSARLEVDLSNYNSVTLIPVLLGKNQEGESVSAGCKERHGEKIIV